MRTWLTMLAAGWFGAALPVVAAEPPPVRLVVKPLLCVVDKGATACNVTFDIRWKSILPAEYCLNDEAQAEPVRCWPSTDAGELQHKREVSEDFVFWLARPAGAERAAEVKIEVLRVGSDDRRRERRTRHVWDVL
ncbi:MAG TPA: DUF3019 domain-containing protein [Steroidobacteraceae bacterium]|nr:DUF3019 domain-containing protein [Steroidobacteraceae bacterium]